MSNCELSAASREAEPPNKTIARLRNWWQSANSDDQYLAAASDPAELERRMRALERATAGPAVETLND